MSCILHSEDYAYEAERKKERKKEKERNKERKKKRKKDVLL